MKKSYLQYGLIAIVLGLYLMRTREGFEAYTEAKCPEGTSPYGYEKCIDKRTPGTEPTCPPEYTDEGGEGEMPCVQPSGRRSGRSMCPADKVEDAVTGKCFDIIPICPATSDLYRDVGPPVSRQYKGICVPKSATTYAATLPSSNPPTQEEIDTICRPGDKIVGRMAEPGPPKCLPMSDLAATTPPSGNTSASDVQGRDVGASTNANYSSVNTDVMKDIINSLKPFRPPTAPASDIEKERKDITGIARQNLFFIQVALFLVVLVMLGYIILPQDSANLIAFALLSVGIAMGFFLKG